MQPLWDIPVHELLHVRAAHASCSAAHRSVRDGFDLWRMPGRKRLALRTTGLMVAADVATRRLQMALADDLADGVVYVCTVPFGPELRGQIAHFHVQAQALAGHAPPAASARAVTRSALLHLRALQALDAAQAGASHREIAQILFGLSVVVLRWHADGELRAQVRHLLRRARAYRDGGYLALAGVQRTGANTPGDETLH
ncbi:DNA -binding domain-containing protein [Variovorax sp. N23]|uniref:DNA -binding domain-containing protein n=1 Tax=Variovorax sp. N23 TaxID=2980555 RepID=UPI0021C8FFFA|nr:DUF2285 domain-containing protein [Variovorax sp. N23]MCU4119002.1 DUF2285 domain-containing protein [Variovorax sp. N23]